ncbi:MAG TPA: phosphotransferase [Edaphobacter sp.]
MEQEDIEHKLTGGNVAGKVVRIGATVRKPVTDSTPNVEAFLLHLSESDFLHSPRSLGRDEDGRYVLEFIEGETISKPELLTLDNLQQVASIIRELHRVSATLPISRSSSWNVAIRPDAEELICHNDLGPWNLVRHGSKWVFIDWDGSGLASRLWDFAYAAQSFVPLAHGGNPEEDAVRLRAFVDGYLLNEHERKQFPQLLSRRTQAGIQRWARIYMLDHGEYWRKAAEYVRKHASGRVHNLGFVAHGYRPTLQMISSLARSLPKSRLPLTRLLVSYSITKRFGGRFVQRAEAFLRGDYVRGTMPLVLRDQFSLPYSLQQPVREPPSRS